MTEKHVVLAVTGSIAAFKAPELASDLVQSGIETRVILTAGAQHFVTALTFEALTGNPVTVDIWAEQPGSSRMGHIELAKWADLLLVAPASADALARLALGLAADALGATALACRAPLVLAPAMESAMFQHSATRLHLTTLRGRGARVVGPETGRLASGAEGVGRMAEPRDILAAVLQTLNARDELAGRSVLVTAGPTFEPIDPVRFIGNRSSGKMGYAVAAEAAQRGARVVLISGPTALPPPAGVELVPVESAEEMRTAVLDRARTSDIVVMAAAVADFRVRSPSNEKLKRRDALVLELEPTADIATEAVRIAPEAFHVGFALETSNLRRAAEEKRLTKGQDLVVANAIFGEHSPFGSDTNQVVLVTAEGAQELPELPKPEVARRLWDEVSRHLERRRPRVPAG